MKTKHLPLKLLIAALFRNRRLFISVIIFSAVLFGSGWLLTRNLYPHAPSDKIDHTLMRERLFVNVNQDSLQQRCEQLGIDFSKPSFFGKNATITMPLGFLSDELNSLNTIYNNEIEVDTVNESIHISCPTVKQDGIRYVSVPVLLLINLLTQ